MTGAPAAPPPISSLVLRFFRGVVRRYFRRHFRAVEALHAERIAGRAGPLVVFGNHSSWWDPMLIVLLGELLLPGQRHYAPIDARALQRYPILGRLGLFPVELATARGAAQFLRTAEAILRGGGVLWVTPQGRFADPRERPLAFKAGLGALAHRLPEVPMVPLAVEYTFWDERLPETLLCFGEPVPAAARSAAEATETLESALLAAMDELAGAAVRRDPAPFTVISTGARGTGGVYGLLRRVGALVRGKRVQLDHTQREG